MSGYRKLERWFGKCSVRGCKTRRVVESFYVPLVNGQNGYAPIAYNGLAHYTQALKAAGVWCADHDAHLTFTQLKGRYSADRECNGVCMAAIGPSCDCTCGGKNHGKNHV